VHVTSNVLSFQTCINLGTLTFQTAFASVKMRPRAEASGIVRRARKKLLDWHGTPGELKFRNKSFDNVQFSKFFEY